jgi:hypothetical protein
VKSVRRGVLSSSGDGFLQTAFVKDFLRSAVSFLANAEKKVQAKIVTAADHINFKDIEATRVSIQGSSI